MSPMWSRIGRIYFCDGYYIFLHIRAFSNSFLVVWLPQFTWTGLIGHLLPKKNGGDFAYSQERSRWRVSCMYSSLCHPFCQRKALFQVLSAHLHWLEFSFGFAPPIAIIIFCCARYKSALARLLSEKRIVLCGEASYSIYLLHLPVIFAFRWEAAPVTSFRVLIGGALRFGLTFLAVIGLSLVVWSLVEVPARRWLRTFMFAGPRAVFPTKPKVPLKLKD